MPPICVTEFLSEATLWVTWFVPRRFLVACVSWREHGDPVVRPCPKDSRRPRQQLSSVKDWSAQTKIGIRRFTNKLADELRDNYCKEGYYESLSLRHEPPGFGTGKCGWALVLSGGSNC